MVSQKYFGAIVVAGLLASASIIATDYRTDTDAHVSVTFQTNHQGYSFVVGRFNKFDGVFN